MATWHIAITCGGVLSAAEASGAETLLEVLRVAGAELSAPCGGNGKCGQCGVGVTGALRAADGAVTAFHGETVLACRWYPAGNLTVALPDTSGEKIVAEGRDIVPCGTGFGLAADIGTTTVAVFLYELSTGKCLGVASAMNAQRSYGSDVISRIRYSSEPDGLNRLSGAVRRQLVTLAKSLCGDLSRIGRFSIAGNTVMEHLFAGLSPESIGVSPFEPLSRFGSVRPARDFFPEAAADAELYLCPAVAGYVGGDITAGLLSSGAYRSQNTVLFLDIGTNGEIALGGAGGFVCCAAAAGPAFEGAEIACGSPAREGAISAVEKDLSVTVLGGKPPVSICGSGVIDAVAALLENGLVDETGKMKGDMIILGGDVYLSARDVRQIQLAKAAVRAGIDTLLSMTGRSCNDITEVLIAGGFGAYMNIKSACAIGLLPPELLRKTRHIGNSAGAGAAMALCPGSRNALRQIADRCRYMELSGSSLFTGRYIDAMMFDEWKEILP